MRALTSKHGARRRRTRGFSLLEILLGLTMVGSFLGALVMVVSASTRAARTGMARQSAESQARRALDRIVRELVSSAVGTLDPDPVAPWGGASLTFQRISSFSEGAIEWGVPARLSLELEPGELDNGLDDNANGLVDEGQLVYTLDPDAPAPQSVVWVKGVREFYPGELPNGLDDNANGLADEAGLSFERRDGRLIVRLCLEETDGQGHTLVHALTTTVRPRNED
jgi:Tfp pilus assembly protein PilW